MVEHAWRHGRREYAHKSRGAILEAICTQREKLQQVVMMYTPAHRGVWANAMADAAAKAGLDRAHGDMSTRIAHTVLGTHLYQHVVRRGAPVPIPAVRARGPYRGVPCTAGTEGTAAP